MESGFALGTKAINEWGVTIEAECIRRCVLKKEKDDDDIDAVTYIHAANDKTYCRCVSGTTNIIHILEFKWRNYYKNLDHETKANVNRFFDVESYACDAKPSYGGNSTML